MTTLRSFLAGAAALPLLAACVSINSSKNTTAAAPAAAARAPITEQQVNAAQQAWCDGLVNVAQVHARGDTVPVGRPKPTIGDLLVQFDSVSRDVKDITQSVEVQLVREGGANDLRRTLKAMADLATTLNRTVEAQSVELAKTMTAVRRGAQALDSAAIDSTVRNLSRTSRNVADLTADLQTTTDKLNGLLGKLEKGEGTAGKLLTDEGLYLDLRRLTTRLDSLTADFKANPRKYIKFSVF